MAETTTVTREMRHARAHRVMPPLPTDEAVFVALLAALGRAREWRRLARELHNAARYALEASRADFARADMHARSLARWLDRERGARLRADAPLSRAVLDELDEARVEAGQVEP